MTDHSYVLLAALRGPRTAEKTVQDYFEPIRLRKGPRREYFRPTDDLIGYVLWLRQQWYVTTSLDTDEGDMPEEPFSSWLPTDATRRVERPVPDPDKLFQTYVQMGTSPLAGTFWAFMPDPLPTYQDYFTPPDIVRRAEEAMGGIDLDAASHFLAHQKFWKAGIKIGDFYSVNRSAFDFEWHGRVWLNPPYGNNEPWFNRAEAMLDRGCVQQLCMLSPMWAFTTALAKPMTRRASASVVLTPTPTFQNPGNPLKTGSNQPHAIFYWGARADAFLDAYEDVGIPFQVVLRNGDV